MSPERIISLSWKIAAQYPDDLQEEFKIALANYIHGFAMVYIGIDNNIANDSWFSETFADKCKYLLTARFNGSAAPCQSASQELITSEFNKSAYNHRPIKISVKSQRTYFSPLIVSG